MWVTFALQKLLTFFQQKKIQHTSICVSLDVKFDESLTNDVVSFEQLGPGLLDFDLSRFHRISTWATPLYIKALRALVSRLSLSVAVLGKWSWMETWDYFI